MAEFRLSPAAERDLEGIWQHSCTQWSIDQANRYIDMLAAAFTTLADFPMTAPACDHIRAGYRRWRVERHIIYFRVTSREIVVVRVLHDRMDASRFF